MLFFVAFRTLPTLDYDLSTETGERGWIGTWYSNGPDGLTAVGDPVKTQLIDETSAFISIDKPKGVASHFTLHLRGKLVPRDVDTKFEFGLIAAGRAKVSAPTSICIETLEDPLAIYSFTLTTSLSSITGRSNGEARRSSAQLPSKRKVSFI